MRRDILHESQEKSWEKQKTTHPAGSHRFDVAYHVECGDCSPKGRKAERRCVSKRTAYRDEAWDSESDASLMKNELEGMR